MVRLTAQISSAQPYYYAFFLVGWKIRRAVSFHTRKHGVWLWFSIALFVLAVLGGGVSYFQEHALQKLKGSLGTLNKAQSLAGRNLQAPSSNESNIKAFEVLLPPHEDIPDLVRSVLQIAEDEGLTIERGDYQSEMDQQGRFSRYKMNLPVKGPSSSIHSFMRKALVNHKNITLDSLQFKREVVGSEIIEAKIQWIILTKLPLREDGKSSSDQGRESK